MNTKINADNIVEFEAMVIEANLEHMSDAEIIAIDKRHLEHMSENALSYIVSRCDQIIFENEPNQTETVRIGDEYYNMDEVYPYMVDDGELGEAKLGFIVVVSLILAALIAVTPTVTFVGLALTKLAQVLPW